MCGCGASRFLRPGPKAHCLGWSPFGSVSTAGPRSPPGRSVWVFLNRGRFAAKTPADDYWILLDFLGFSRPNLDLSMGYSGFSTILFSCALPGGRQKRDMLLATGKRGYPCGKLNSFSVFLQYNMVQDVSVSAAPIARCATGRTYQRKHQRAAYGLISSCRIPGRVYAPRRLP
jgi:hypothetical protein